MSFELQSAAFADGGAIPAAYTCQGQDVSPPLSWRAAPPGTQSFALIVDDPDAPDPAAPRMTWVHWLLYNLPAGCDALPEGVPEAGLPPGTGQGKNDWKRAGYGGPCPPVGRHRYYFKLYALDAVLPHLGQPTKEELEAAMRSRVLAMTQLMGTYQKT